MLEKGVNDIAWETLFEDNNIIEKVNQEGFFKITANQIKKVREPRLMTKFDCKGDLPEIFKKNDLSILPTKRGEYIIGKFKNYEAIEIDNNIFVETRFLPDYITTINKNNITSEAVALSAAYISGMINDIFNEEMVLTVSGRMSSKQFSYEIDTTLGNKVNIEVDNSQLEIDGSYEGPSKFVIIEAKNHYLSDFIVRQLYYPYRVWKKLVKKEVIPVLLIKHDNIFNFYIYEFENVNNYNSIKLVKIKRYILGEEYIQIEFADIIDTMNKSVRIKEDPSIPFPQADSFYRVLDFINALNDLTMTTKEIAELYEFDERQGSYYSAAARYLGFVERIDGRYSLTKKGRKLMEMDHKTKNLEIVKSIISHEPFYFALEQYLSSGSFDSNSIANIILKCSSKVGSFETAKRRTQSVISWVKWIFNLATNYYDNEL